MRFNKGDIILFEKENHKPDFFVSYIIDSNRDFYRFQIMFCDNKLFQGRTYQFNESNKNSKYMRKI